MLFTIADRTYTDDPSQARKPVGAKAPRRKKADEVVEGDDTATEEVVVATPTSTGPFVADEEHGLYTMGQYDMTDLIEVKIPGNPGKLSLAPGVQMILGPSKSGKTWLVDQIAGMNGYPRISFEEPVAHALVGVKSLAKAMMQIPTLTPHGVVLDSIRTLFYTTAGNTGKGGLNMSLYAMLTQWDIWAKSHSKLVFVVVNPIQISEEILESIREAGQGSVETYIATPRRGVIRVSSRADNRDDREYLMPQTKDVSKSPNAIYAPAPLRTEPTNEVDGILSLFTVLSARNQD